MVNRQQICFAFIIAALQKLTKVNRFYNININITIDNEWEDFSEHSDSVLWKLLNDKNTDKNAREFNNSDQIDSDNDIEGNDKSKKDN